MKNISLILIFLISVISALTLTGCNSEEKQRQEIIERYTGGEKKVVATYTGSGSEEMLTYRQTFSLGGDLVLLEDIEYGAVTDWLGLNPEVMTSAGLQEYLQGDWLWERENNVIEVLKIDGNAFNSITTDKENNEEIYRSNGEIIFSDGLVIRILLGSKSSVMKMIPINTSEVQYYDESLQRYVIYTK